MALLIAPYNNAMRLGQGYDYLVQLVAAAFGSLTIFIRFNSYTQQICVDDAVVIDPNRAENVVTNDGTTMRIMVQKSATPSAWTRQKEVIAESPATAVLVANAAKAKDEVELIAKQLADDEAEGEPNHMESHR